MEEKPIRIVTCSKVPYNRKYVLIHNGRKEITQQAIHYYGLDHLNTECIVAEELLRFPIIGGKVYGDLGGYEHCQTIEQTRSVFYKDLKGTGVEFGAATKPTSVPLDCVVHYADKFDEKNGCNTGYRGVFVPVSYRTDMESMKGIAPGRLDFIIHNHVLEHVRNPIRACNKAYKKLKPGGKFYFALPNKEKTFDRLRKPTSIRHLKADYYKPSIYREIMHVAACCIINNFSAEGMFSAIRKGLKGNWENVDFHWHVFTVKSVKRILQWYTSEICQWKSFEVVEGAYLDKTNEIYIRMIK